ncbi:tetratricopeptide repeat protein [Caldimonas sp. KR1-144]|uniref:tetratricopeptide repeat protein n=1 Tax=Caldimonas sp. KR1-144 TaxID=3400911 RepID=UPI003C1172FE
MPSAESLFAKRVLVVLVAASLGACAGGKRAARTDEPPTLKTLASRRVDVGPDPGVQGGPDQAIAAYKKFLEVSPKAPQRAEAMRRLGDLEMDSVDERQVAGTATGTASDYRAAIARYQDYLRQFPNDPGNDRVLYQLSRAQEQGGDLEAALKTLDRLVGSYPKTAYRDEAQFRRGELLFATRDYTRAEQAYTTVLAGETDRLRDRALYMQGWSQFKQGKLEEGLRAFFGVLDLKIAHREGEGGLETLEGLSRADRELVEDTFRVTSLSLANLQGAASIAPYVDSDERRSYEFRVYEQLGELYLKQERVKDAADTFGAFARLRPLHAQAPQLQARVIEIYQRNGFANLALDAKKDYVTRYGVDSEFRRANEAGWERAQPLVKTHLAELAQHYHASAQKSKSSADYQEAVKWYRASLASFPDDADAPKANFLLAELLFEDGQFADAAQEYEKTAYGYPAGARSADAGYAALLAFANQEKRVDAAQREPLQRAGVDSALRFASTFPADPRASMVLTNSAEKLFALKDGERAVSVAQQVLALNPPAPAAQRRVAWTVVAHTAFERNDFAAAEKAYGEVLALVPEKDAGRGELTERLAASVYRQGEAARSAGNAPEAVKHFERVAAVAPNSAVRATAQYDAAAALIGMKDWPAATKLLEDFRTRFPKHALQDDVTTKLAVAYTEQRQWSAAAAEYERIAAAKSDPAIVGAAVWQAAELHEKANARPAATKAYERYLKQHAPTLDTGLEARLRLAQLAKADGNKARELALMKEIAEADRRAGAQRTDRSRFLGASATLALAEPALEAYRKVELVEPLARQLKLKKQKMEDALKAYAAAADYGVAEVTTASTFHTAALYQDFGRAMLKSERPKKLSKLELEQYNVLLEEQAFPFEEKATELHETNARRAATGLYDEWVQKSFKALAELRPVRYGKNERSEGAIDAIR